MKSQVATDLLIVLSVVNWWLLRSRPAWMRLATSGILLGLLTAAMGSVVGSPLQPRFTDSDAGLMVWQQGAVVVWWFLAARWLVHAVHAVLLNRNLGGEGRLLSDLLAGVIYLAAFLTIASVAFGLPIRGLLATSGVIAIILGLALQSTLADVFSGIAIGIEHPYSVGDRVWIEGSIEGVIVQINWRSIRIRTDGNDIATLPHSLAAKSRVINRSVPTSQRSDSVRFSCAASAPAEQVAELARHAIMLCPTILPAPKPSVGLVRLGKRSNNYEVGFAVADSRDLWESKTALLRQVLRQFRAADIQAFDRHGDSGRPQGPRARQALAGVQLFQMLSEDQLSNLSRQALPRALRPGETLFSQGDTEGSLFVVCSGVMEVASMTESRSATIGRIGVGDYIGEIGLLTGAPHAATVVALTETEVVELRKEHVAPLLDEKPELMHAFEQSARRGQALYERSVAATVGGETVQTGQFLARIRQYFRGFALS